MLDVIHPLFLFEPGLVIVFDLVHTCKIDNTRNGISKPKQLVAKISFASYKHEYMGQFLQGGKNGRLMSFFLKVEPPCDQT